MSTSDKPKHKLPAMWVAGHCSRGRRGVTLQRSITHPAGIYRTHGGPSDIRKSVAGARRQLCLQAAKKCLKGPYLKVLQCIVAKAACLNVLPEAFLFCVLAPHRRTLRCLRCRELMQARLSKACLKAVPTAYFGVCYKRTPDDQSHSSNVKRSHARVPSEAVVQIPAIMDRRNAHSSCYEYTNTQMFVPGAI